MSFFDQPYYALTKANMSRIGMWPEQSRHARITRRFIALALALTFVLPRLTRLNAIWEDTASLLHDMPYVLTGGANIFMALRMIQHFDEITLSYENMKRHWEMLKNTSAVVVLDKYAERGRCTAIVYTAITSSALITYLLLCLSPMILDVINPLNESRPKIYIFCTEDGIDKDKYYWFKLIYEYIVAMAAVAMVIALQTVYSTWAVHACALFEVVSFNLKLIRNRHTANKENYITRCNDWNYKKTCDCITAHKMAISFAELIESICCGPLATTVVLMSLMIIFTGIQALIYLKHRDMLVQSVVYMILQVLNLYIISAPGQELIDHSQKIHTNAYNMAWPDMSVKVQKLVILIMIRSNKPCCFTARKLYVLSMENFGSTIRTVMSYFMIFAQMI